MTPLQHVIPRIILLMLCMLTISVGAYAEECYDMQCAREYCDRTSLAPPEGIWSFPQDNVTVLISSRESEDGVYDIRVVESLNGAIEPGLLIGEMRRSPESGVYKLTFFGKDKSLLKWNQSFVATIKSKGETMSLRKRKYNLRFNILSLLPHLGRLLRVSADDPVADIPIGLYKVYPSYDGNGSSRLKPRAL